MIKNIIVVMLLIIQCSLAGPKFSIQEIAELPFPIAYHSAVVSGEKLVIAGGITNDEEIINQNPCVISYDTKTWEKTVWKNVHLSGGGSSLTAVDNKIIFTGGNPFSSKAVWLEVEEESYKIIPLSRQIGLFDATVLPFKKGVIEIGGGFFSKINGKFFSKNKILGTRETRIINFEKEFSGPKLKRRRTNHASVLDSNSRDIYVFFGENTDPYRSSPPEGSIEVLVNENGVYNESKLVKINHDGNFIDRKDCEAVLVENEIYIVGGQIKFFFKEGEIKNINTGLTQVFSIKDKSLKKLSPMNKPRSDFHLILFDDGFLAIGGEGNKKNGSSEGASLASIEFFDFKTGDWQEIEQLPIPLADFSCNMIAENKWVIVGGHDHKRNFSKKIFLLTKG